MCGKGVPIAIPDQVDRVEEGTVQVEEHGVVGGHGTAVAWAGGLLDAPDAGAEPP